MRLSFVFVFCLLFAMTAVLLLPGTSVAWAAQATRDIFVSPQGDDAAAGTLEAPLQTLFAAKEKLKTLKGAVGEDETVHVWLRGGRYELTETLYFTGDDLPNVTFAAYNGEPVTISGARAVTGFAEETVNGVKMFTKTLDPEKDPAGFRSLFSESEQLSVPRYPEEGYFTVNKLCPEDDLWTEENTPWDFTKGQRSFCADPADLTEFTNPTQIAPVALYRRVRWERGGFEMLTEMVFKPLRLGVRFFEVPTKNVKREEGRSHRTFGAALLYYYMILKIRFTDIRKLTTETSQ